MKNIFLFLSICMLISCEKSDKKVEIANITNESNYEITRKKENDTIYQITGENNQYHLLSGYKDVKNKRKIGWWKIKDKVNEYQYEIQFVFLKKNKENQIKVYKSGKLINEFSMYYNILYINNGYQFKFYFPKYNNEDKEVEFGYITSDGSTTPTRKTIKCKKENDSYNCFIPVKNKYQLIAGIVTQFVTSEEINDKISLSSTSMYVSTPQ